MQHGPERLDRRDPRADLDVSIGPVVPGRRRCAHQLWVPGGASLGAEAGGGTCAWIYDIVVAAGGALEGQSHQKHAVVPVLARVSGGDPSAGKRGDAEPDPASCLGGGRGRFAFGRAAQEREEGGHGEDDECAHRRTNCSQQVTGSLFMDDPRKGL